MMRNYFPLQHVFSFHARFNDSPHSFFPPCAVCARAKSAPVQLRESWGDDWIENLSSDGTQSPGDDEREEIIDHTSAIGCLFSSFSHSFSDVYFLNSISNASWDCYWICFAVVSLYSLTFPLVEALSLYLHTVQSHFILYSRRLHRSSKALYCC